MELVPRTRQVAFDATDEWSDADAMRLREMQTIVRRFVSAIGAVEVENVTSQPSGAAAARVTRWSQALPAMSALCEVPAVASAAELCFKQPWHTLIEDPGFTTTSLGQSMSRSLNELRRRCEIFLLAADAVLAPLPELSVSVKLPPVANFTQLAEFANGMHLAIANPTSLLFGDCVRIHGFDTGSNWIDFVIDGGVAAEKVGAVAAVTGVAGVLVKAGGVEVVGRRALRFIGELVKLGTMIAHRLQQHEVTSARVRALVATADLTATIADAAAADVRRFAEGAAGTVVDEHAPDGMSDSARNEAKAAALKGAMQIAEFLREDTRFYASLPAAPAAAGGETPEKEDPWKLQESATRALSENPIAQLAQWTGAEPSKPATNVDDPGAVKEPKE